VTTGVWEKREQNQPARILENGQHESSMFERNTTERSQRVRAMQLAIGLILLRHRHRNG
jgi:hypothetical protein